MAPLQRWFPTLVALVLVAVAAAAMFLFIREPSLVPKEMLEKINFTVYVPAKSDRHDAWVLVNDSTAFEDNQGVLSLVATSGNNKMFIKEQIVPGTFTDIPNFYNKMLEKLHHYQEIQTSLGTVTLTRPEELQGKQSAVLNAAGTLLFASPEQELSESQWHAFFKQLTVIR